MVRISCKRWETLVSVIVWVLILAIVVGSVARIVAVHYATEDQYSRNETLYLLQNNATNVMRKLDTSSVNEKDIFYVYKDSANKRYLVMTGATADQYKYVDRRGEWVSNTGSFAGTVYTQSFLMDKVDTYPTKKQIIKGEVRELIRAK